MANADQFPETFDLLRGLLTPYADRLTITVDEPDNYSLDTRWRMPNGKPLFFGTARIGKRAVSFHLMPVYVFPELLDDLPPALRKRMQGKSCFNFVALDADARERLAELTRRGFAAYAAAGYV